MLRDRLIADGVPLSAISDAIDFFEVAAIAFGDTPENVYLNHKEGMIRNEQ